MEPLSINRRNSWSRTINTINWLASAWDDYSVVRIVQPTTTTSSTPTTTLLHRIDNRISYNIRIEMNGNDDNENSERATIRCVIVINKLLSNYTMCLLVIWSNSCMIEYQKNVNKLENCSLFVSLDWVLKLTLKMIFNFPNRKIGKIEQIRWARMCVVWAPQFVACWILTPKCLRREQKLLRIICRSVVDWSGLRTSWKGICAKCMDSLSTEHDHYDAQRTEKSWHEIQLFGIVVHIWSVGKLNNWTF